MARLFSRTAQQARAPFDDVVLGLYLSGGKSAPIALKSSGLSLQALSRAFPMLSADDTGLALAYASNPIANRCVDLRSQKVSEMPWRVVRKVAANSARSRREVLDDHPLALALKYSQRLYRKNVLYAWQSAKCIHGEVYLEKVRDGAGRPAALRWLNPIAVEPQIYDGAITQFDYTQMDGGRIVTFAPDELIYDYYHNPLDDFRGLSPTQIALDAINSHNAYRQHLLAYWRNGAAPGGILAAKQNTTIGKSDSDRLMTWFKEQVSGVKNRFRWVFLPAALEFQEVQEKPSPQYAELERGDVKLICDAYGVPVPVVDFDEQRFQLSEEQPKLFYENTVIPECADFAALMNTEGMEFFDDGGAAVFEFDFDKIRAMMSNQVQRSTAINARQMAGNMTLNEAREQFGDAPVAGGDVFFVPKANQPVPQEDLPKLADILKDAQTPATQGLPEERKVPRQNSPEDELKAWERAACNDLKRARRFQAALLPVAIAERARADLTALADETPKAALKALFETLRAELKALLEDADLPLLVERLQTLHMASALDAA